MATKKKTKPAAQSIDPRLQRVFDILEAAWDRLSFDADDRTFDTLVEKVVDALHGGTATWEGAKQTILALAVDCEKSKIDECVALAEGIHRETCVCCRDRKVA